MTLREKTLGPESLRFWILLNYIYNFTLKENVIIKSTYIIP